ncbi:MAG: pyridoxamine 5'-phosphate oxidase family protein [Chloroflexi bacterium]|nr:MAG: pyridoxamine 5'-phosphate oxidase family protein [Chloroflexota bacterium]
MAHITTDQVWQEVEKQLFAVLGMVTASGEARTAGIVYVVHQRKLYISSLKTAWKIRHIRANPSVSLTIPIHKQIPLLPWIKIPAATITFSGRARILEPSDLPPEVVKPLFRGMTISPETSPPFAVIEVTPAGDFITYGVGVPLLTMRDPQKARGRVAVA